jgi:predicted nucleotidyltransferase
MAKTTNEALKIAKNYVDLVRKAFFVNRAYLFGSYVYGKPHKWSDIDIAIVSEDFLEMPSMVAGRILCRLATHVDFDIEPVVLWPEEIEKPMLGSVAYEIARSGKLIYSSG